MTDQTETSGELVTYQPAPAQVARRDMRNPATDSWTEVVRATSILAEQICQTEFVPAGLRGSAAKVTAAMLYGRELGLAPMGALGAVHVIKGKAGLYAETMRGLILQAGHQIRVHESSASRCVLNARRAGDDEWSTFSYTMDEAKRAGDVAQNQNYQTRPAEMLLARCTTRMARAIFADVIHGLRSVEELEDMGPDTDARTGEVQVQQSARTAQRETRREQPRAVAAAPAERPAPSPSEPPAAEQEPARTVRRQTRREAPRGRTRPSGDGVGEAPPAGTPQGEGSPSGEESTPADDRGIDPTAPSPDAGTTPRCSLEQVGLMQAEFARIGVTERDEKLYWVTVLAGRPETEIVSSSKVVSRYEASRVIDQLKTAGDRAALESMGAALGGDDDAE